MTWASRASGAAADLAGQARLRLGVFAVLFYGMSGDDSCLLWRSGLFINAVFAFHLLSMYFISVCWRSLNRTKGLGEASSVSGGQKLVFWKHYHNLVHLSSRHACLPLCALFAAALSYVCIFAIIRGRTAGRYRKSLREQLFLTAGVWPRPSFSLPLCHSL